MEMLQISFFEFWFKTLFFTQKIIHKITNGSAIKGYDTVAYFMELKASKGKSEFRYKWGNSEWLFSSQANLDSFKANPQKYAPQYGGLCAFGVSFNRKAFGSPHAWTIVEGKLYLNYNLKVRELWLKDCPTFIQKANEFWPLLKSNALITE